MSHQVLRCGVCSSEDLSPETGYSSFDNHARFVGLGGTGLLGGIKDLEAGATRARVCLSCGYLMLFVSESVRDSLVDSFGG